MLICGLLLTGSEEIGAIDFFQEFFISGEQEKLNIVVFFEVDCCKQIFFTKHLKFRT